MIQEGLNQGFSSGLIWCTYEMLALFKLHTAVVPLAWVYRKAIFVKKMQVFDLYCLKCNLSKEIGLSPSYL